MLREGKRLSRNSRTTVLHAKKCLKTNSLQVGYRKRLFSSGLLPSVLELHQISRRKVPAGHGLYHR